MSTEREIYTHPEYDEIIEQIAELSPDKYYDFVFRHPMSFYRERVEMIGARGFDRVLDAGHGFGQWSIALAEVNDFVEAVDHNQPRCDISEIMKSEYSANNMNIVCAPLDKLENLYEADSFDLIWCWGVIMFVDRKTIMPIFNRLLRENGLLMLGATNTPQRWRYKYDKGKKDGLDNPNYYKFCEQGIAGLERETGVNAFSVSREQSSPIADKYGFDIDQINYDGHINLMGGKPLLFEPEVDLKNQNVEMIFKKKFTIR